MKSQMKLKKNKWGTIHVDLQVLQVTRGSLTNDIGLWCLESATDLTTVYYYGLIQVLRRNLLYICGVSILRVGQACTHFIALYF